MHTSRCRLLPFAMPLNWPCHDFVSQWNGGACSPARNGPGLDLGARVTDLGSRPNAWSLGVCVGLEAGIVDFLLMRGCQSPGGVLGVLPQRLLRLFAVC